MLIQMYMNFLGGSISALVIMNLASPLLDKTGLQKSTETKEKIVLPKSKQFTAVNTVSCMRCGACMCVCCHRLSPILLKEAFDKGNTKELKHLRVELCDGCGNCNHVCPSRIDLKASIL